MSEGEKVPASNVVPEGADAQACIFNGEAARGEWGIFIGCDPLRGDIGLTRGAVLLCAAVLVGVGVGLGDPRNGDTVLGGIPTTPSVMLTGGKPWIGDTDLIAGAALLFGMFTVAEPWNGEIDLTVCARPSGENDLPPEFTLHSGIFMAVVPRIGDTDLTLGQTLAPGALLTRVGDATLWQGAALYALIRSGPGGEQCPRGDSTTPTGASMETAVASGVGLPTRIGEAGLRGYGK